MTKRISIITIIRSIRFSLLSKKRFYEKHLMALNDIIITDLLALLKLEYIQLQEHKGF